MGRIEAAPARIFVRTVDVVSGDLWRLFPCVNVDRTKDVPYTSLRR